ncbi:hypothetical protein COE08_27900 [Priestia megaterium]|jgi:hypothetical protein|uniref:hypothetical protein n=1 Tax=Priestia megaterium TaxID=1404 RepID=UPI000BF7E2BA|nr:hypothetical protein [Priestia megaterium]MBW0933045.1 hypothetical protein [Priestia megaterium]PFE33091.1 hypothetical protein CN270_12740 [Priestia megaterium]PFJ38629.1 hypothetical protein COJ00_28920 [Priestia megaterium]PGX13597.1 hypothetical protein COE08_27900 [Priestia megaterium]
MKNKDFLLSIVLNVFLAYLWIFLIYLIFDFVKLKDNALLFGIVLASIGTLLLPEVVRRVNPFIEYKITHPVKVAGFISFGFIGVVNLYWISF